LLTAGMLFGAIWAKIAWGTYWGWDVKETGAFLSWAIYLVYIHLKSYTRLAPRTHLVMLTLAFLMVVGCWVGVNYLPNAQSSAHTYSMNSQ
jgi:ABC-type transport system involved in cytochrome c biogenesis permease subunit